MANRARNLQCCTFNGRPRFWLCKLEISLIGVQTKTQGGAKDFSGVIKGFFISEEMPLVKSVHRLFVERHKMI